MQFCGLIEIKYPNFSYSPEEIFAGKIDFLSIDFISGKSATEVDSEGNALPNQNSDWQNIRYVISEWYKVLRMITIIGLLAVLIYTGIKIIISSNTKDKAKYKEMILNWFVAVVLAFSMQYIMAFIINIIQEIIGLFSELTGEIQVIFEDKSFKTNLIGLARFQMQQIHFSGKLGHLVIYTALITYTFKFTFLYLKRVLKMAFLTIISPIVALTYPLDKMDGDAKGFNMWLKEYIYNALLQLMHYMLYYILVTTSLSLAANNPVYGIVALMFISEAEKLLKKIFGFDKAKAGTVGGLAGAYATGAITSQLTKMVKDPLHPLGGGKGKGSHGGAGRSRGQLVSGGNSNNSEDDVPNDVIDDIDIYHFLNTDRRGNSSSTRANSQSGSQENEVTDSSDDEPRQINPQESPQESEEQEDSINPVILAALGIDDSISRYRTYLSQYSNEELGGLSFNEGDPVGSIDEMLRMLSKYQDNLKRSGNGTPGQTKELKEKLLRLKESSLLANEIDFTSRGIELQYIDGDKRSTGDLIDEIIRLNELANDPKYSARQRRRYAREAQKLLEKVQRRMIENQYIQRQGGPQALQQYNFGNITSDNMDGILQAFNQYQTQLDNGVNIPERTLQLNDRLLELKNSLPDDLQNEDGEDGSMNDLLDDIMKYNKLANNTALNKTLRQGYARKAQERLEELKRRMNSTARRQENPINSADPVAPVSSVNPVVSGNIGTTGNIVPTRNIDTPVLQQQDGEQRSAPAVARGLTNVARTIAKPVWDTEKGVKYNGKRLVGSVVRGIAGVTVGIGAAAVQAGISITDGKYNPVEGIATIGAGMAGVSRLSQGVGRGVGNIRRTYIEGAHQGEQEKSMAEYSEQWFNRDDIISNYNREFPGQGKEMRRRAVNNYVSRGITKFDEQKQAIKFAEYLIRERGMDMDAADRLSAATLQYKQTLARTNNYYNIIHSRKKRLEYLDAKVETYTGSASRDAVRRLHEDFIKNVSDFDKANE